MARLPNPVQLLLSLLLEPEAAAPEAEPPTAFVLQGGLASAAALPARHAVARHPVVLDAYETGWAAEVVHYLLHLY